MIQEPDVKINIMTQATIHPSAIIDPTAKIADNVTIGPWTMIGPHVEIGAGTTIGSHVVIKQRTKLGSNNKIASFVSLGEDPQHLGYKGEETWLLIGDNNTIREYSTLNRGTVPGGGKTVIGDNNLIMCYVHIAHDCHIGNHTIFVNNASLAGHVSVGDYAMIGVFVGVHQNCKIGAYSFVTQAAMVTQDVLPYLLVAGHNPKVAGLNAVGLKRRGFNLATIRALREAFEIIFRRELTTAQAIEQLQALAAEHPEVQLFVDGLQSSQRGVIRR